MIITDVKHANTVHFLGYDVPKKQEDANKIVTTGNCVFQFVGTGDGKFMGLRLGWGLITLES